MNLILTLVMIILFLVVYLYLLHKSDKFYVKSLNFWVMVWKKLKKEDVDDKNDDSFWDAMYKRMKERWEREER